MRTFRNLWQHGARALNARSDPLRFRITLGAVALGLALWLIFAADKPWKLHLTHAGGWNLSELVAFYSCWAGALNLGLLAVLIWTARWWAHAGDPVNSQTTRGRRVSTFFWLGVIGAMAVAGTLSSKRLNFGLAHDEDLSARRAIIGEYKLAPDGRVLPPRLKWQNTFFDYRKPTNHVLYSVLARSAWTTWRMFAHAEDWWVREWVIRLPAWLAGISTVLALGLLVARLGGELAGVLSAWLLAVHPWFLRYASEARGYSVLLLMVPVILLVWLRATRENRWRWWLAFGACQFLILWVYPAAVYILVVLNGSTALWLAGEWRHRPGDTRFRRWLAATLIAAIPVSQLMLPLAPQFLNYLRTAPEARQPLKLCWLMETSSSLLVGAGWNKSGSLSSPYIELAPQAFEHPLLFASLLAILTVAVAVGVLRTMSWMWPQGIIVAATLLFPAGLAAGLAKATNQWLFEWYLIYLLPGLVAMAAIGAGGREMEPSSCRGASSPRSEFFLLTQDSPSPFATAFVESPWIQSKRS